MNILEEIKIRKIVKIILYDKGKSKKAVVAEYNRKHGKEQDHGTIGGVEYPPFSPETRRLAQQVVDMPQSTETIFEWADRLAYDICGIGGGSSN